MDIVRIRTGCNFLIPVYRLLSYKDSNIVFLFTPKNYKVSIFYFCVIIIRYEEYDMRIQNIQNNNSNPQFKGLLTIIPNGSLTYSKVYKMRKFLPDIKLVGDVTINTNNVMSIESDIKSKSRIPAMIKNVIINIESNIFFIKIRFLSAIPKLFYQLRFYHFVRYDHKLPNL